MIHMTSFLRASIRATRVAQTTCNVVPIHPNPLEPMLHNYKKEPVGRNVMVVHAVMGLRQQGNKSSLYFLIIGGVWAFTVEG
eukprot:428508-Amphidinium_carterae.1